MRYSEEFRNDAVALVRAGASQREVCRDLGVSKSDAKVRELMRRNKLLEQENEVLRRAAAYLSQIHITPPK